MGSGIARRVGVAAAAVALCVAAAPAVVSGAAPREAAGPHAGLQTSAVCGAVRRFRARCSAVRVLNPGALPRPERRPSRSTTTTVKPTTTSSSTTTSSTTTTVPTGTCTTAHAGHTPCDLQSAYNLASSSGGAGETVAIVDAYDDPRAETDLATYRATYGLPPCTTGNGCFRKVNQNGGATAPPANTGWAEEISLDLDMVSAICPNCHILLVEASSNSLTNLLAAEDRAAAMGANAISNSWGASEFSQEAAYDNHFSHGIVITASSGDSGYGVEWPSSSPNVVAVGGTSLTTSAGPRGWAETAWSGAGSGCSAFEAKPSWQHDAGCSKRTVADVSAVADPYTGVAVYDTYHTGGWLVFGGTSVASPIIASVYALAGNTSTSAAASLPYAHASSLYDVTSGSNGACAAAYLCTAGAGYDGPTGLGTPDATAAF